MYVRAPILAANIPVAIKSLNRIPTLARYAHHIINLCALVAAATPHARMPQYVVALLITPLALTAWNSPQTDPPWYTTRESQCGGPRATRADTIDPTYTPGHRNPTRCPTDIPWPPLDHPPGEGKPTYHEKQRAQMCMVHSINNLLGGPYIDPNHVLSYCHAMTRHMSTNRLTAASAIWGHAHNPNTGNFTTLVLNHYLRYNVRVRDIHYAHYAHYIDQHQNHHQQKRPIRGFLKKSSATRATLGLHSAHGQSRDRSKTAANTLVYHRLRSRRPPADR